MFGPGHNSQPEGGSEKSFNYSILPNSVPEDLSGVITPSERLHEKFKEFAHSLKAVQVNLENPSERRREAEMVRTLTSIYKDYFVKDGRKGDVLSYDTMDPRISWEGSMLLLADVVDRFYGVVPVNSLQGLGWSEESSRRYERFAKAVRLLVTEITMDDGRSGIEVQPLVSEEAYLEMVEHLRDLGKFIESHQKGAAPNAVAPVSCLANTLIATIEEKLAKDRGKMPIAETISISKIENITVKNDHDFAMTVVIDRYGETEEGNIKHVGSTKERHTFLSHLDPYGFVDVRWEGYVIIDQPRGR